MSTARHGSPNRTPRRNLSEAKSKGKKKSRPSNSPVVIRVEPTRQCDVDKIIYSSSNDLVRFGVLTVNGIPWNVCGDCITALWDAREPTKKYGRHFDSDF